MKWCSLLPVIIMHKKALHFRGRLTAIDFRLSDPDETRTRDPKRDRLVF